MGYTNRHLSPLFRFGIPCLGLSLGLAEASFIFLARWGLKEGGLRILFWLSAVALFRFLCQDGMAQMEARAFRETVTGLRQRVLQTLRSQAVPLYRTDMRRRLVQVLGPILLKAGEGCLADRRVQASVLQGMVLFPCLFFFSGQVAFLTLGLALPVALAVRWRSHSLRILERQEVEGRELSEQQLLEFGENLENVGGGQGLESSSRALEESLLKALAPQWQWQAAQIRYPALLEVGFFFALATLVIGGRSFLSGWNHWILFSGLLLLAYKPLREAARHYPLRLQGKQALLDCEQWIQESEVFPLRTTPKPGKEPSQSNALGLYQVSFGYGNDSRVFQSFSADFDLQKITGITGPNGAGKTTLLRLVSGLEVPQLGSIYWAQSLLQGGGPVYLPQRIFIGQDYREWAKAWSQKNPLLWQELKSLLQVEKLIAKSHFHPEGFSGGEKQRLALLRVLASDAPFLLLDEPTLAIPAHERESILAGALAFWTKRQRGAIVVSHELFLPALCDAFFVLDIQPQSLFSGPEKRSL